MKTKLAAAVAGLLLAAVPAWAHHAFAAEFDSRKPVHLEGIVSKVELINPHAWIHIEAGYRAVFHNQQSQVFNTRCWAKR